MVMAICIILVLYPYVVYPLALRLLPTKTVNKQIGYKTSATLLFCAYNESSCIAEKISNVAILKARHPDLEILAFDDGSSDSTYEQLAAHPNLVKVVRGTGRNGKANGMKRLAALATGEILITLIRKWVACVAHCVTGERVSQRPRPSVLSTGAWRSISRSKSRARVM